MGKHGANTAQDIHSLNTWQTPGSPALTVCRRPKKKTGPDWLPYSKMGRDWLSVSGGGFRLPYDLNHLIQIGDEVLEVVKATLPDLSQVLSEWSLQLLLQIGVLSNQHLHYHAKRLTVLPVHLENNNTTSETGANNTSFWSFRRCSYPQGISVSAI